MLTVNKLIPQGRGLAAVLVRRAPTVELDWDVRARSRFDATDSSGRVLGVFLPRGTVVRGGDVLVAEDGSFVRVVAAAQPVMVVRHCADHGSPLDLLRAAYHLGNRHVALDVRPDRLTLEPDHVLAAMLRRQHLLVEECREPFEPEAGAYGAAGHGSHGHGHPGHDHPGHVHHAHDHHAPDHHGHDHRGHDHHGHDHHGHDPHDDGHAHHHRPAGDHGHGHGNPGGSAPSSGSR